MVYNKITINRYTFIYTFRIIRLLRKIDDLLILVIIHNNLLN
jgi:hypothetical protein